MLPHHGVGDRDALHAGAVSIAGVVSLLAFDLPYRLALPLAVIAAIVAGSAADLMVERADLRRIRNSAGDSR